MPIRSTPCPRNGREHEHYLSHSYEKSNKAELVELERRVVSTRGWEKREWEGWGKVDQWYYRQTLARGKFWCVIDCTVGLPEMILIM